MKDLKNGLKAGAFAFCLAAGIMMPFTAGIMMPFTYDKWTMPVPLVYFWFGIMLYIASLFFGDE